MHEGSFGSRFSDVVPGDLEPLGSPSANTVAMLGRYVDGQQEGNTYLTLPCVLPITYPLVIGSIDW